MNIRRVSHLRCTPKRDGVALVLTVFLLVLVVAFAAFVVDVGYILLNQNQLQTAADSAAFAGASAMGQGDSLWWAYVAAKRMSRKTSIPPARAGSARVLGWGRGGVVNL